MDPDEGRPYQVGKDGRRSVVASLKDAWFVDWAVLVISGVLESVWALALDRSEGFSAPVPTAVFLIALAGSMIGLGYATKTLPIGIAYAVWTGIGVTVTALVSMASGSEPASAVKLLLLVGLVTCVAGLKIVSDAH